MEIADAREIIEESINNQGYEIIYRSNNSGCVLKEKKVVYAPFAKTRATLYVLCHETAHVFYPKGSKRTYENEMFAEKKAHEYMRMFGFSVPRKQTRRAKRYVARRLRMSLRRGLKEKINPEVKRFIS